MEKFSQQSMISKERGKGRRKNQKMIIYYDCDKFDHKRSKCPNKKRFIKQASTPSNMRWEWWWDHNERESQEEVANICFMVIDDEENSIEKCSYYDLSISYDDILEKFEKLAVSHSVLKRKSSLSKNEVKKISET